jgi:diguanylate cyclase (GGDEF)-like protein
VLIYRFEPNWSGVVVEESVDSNWMPILGQKIDDPCFGSEACIESYSQGRIHLVEDIYTAGLAPCYISLLAPFQVRANLVVPILQGQQSNRNWDLDEQVDPALAEAPHRLWGLLIAHHCSRPRRWQQWEINLLQQLTTQVGIAIQQSELYQQLELANQRLHSLASSDGLTQVANRRRFDEYLEMEWRRLAREQAPLSLILCDVDFFKRYNDTYGHLAGDEVLRQVASTLSQAIKRPADLVARYGGEEFGVLLPKTDLEGAVQVANLIQTGIKALEIPQTETQSGKHITLSFGVASLIPEYESSPEILIAAADRALYQAKAQGRDRINTTNDTGG